LPPLINYDPSLYDSDVDAIAAEPSPTLASTPNSLGSTFINTSSLSPNGTINQWTSITEPSFTSFSTDTINPPSNKSNQRSSVVEPSFTPSSSNRWSSSEIRILIEQAGKHQQALQQVKDPREKGRIWDKIISIIQNSNIASSALKKRTKASIQQKWDSLLQKYRNIKDRIASTGEGAIQNEWEYFNDMDKYLRNDPSIIAPVTSDSISGIKHKEQDTIENQEEEV
jgi:hypothetical protein